LKKDYGKGIQLRGKPLGLVGYGRIGQEVARIGLGLGMRILPTDPGVDEANIDFNLNGSDEIRLAIKLTTTDFDTVLEKSDFITFHVPNIGRALIGTDELAKMKDGSYIVNTARGGMADEKALLEALNSGKLAGAGIDVFDNEPTPMKELLQHPNVSVTPHIGAATLEAQSNIGLELADKILAFYGADK